VSNLLAVLVEQREPFHFTPSLSHTM
jgi:hypothetical protein